MVILGADKWPNWPELDNNVFRRSYEGFRLYLEQSLQLSSAQILDLFGSEDAPHALTEQIRTYLTSALAPDSTVTDVVIYYVGHGDTLGVGGDYAVFTASADKSLKEASALRVSFIDEAIRDANRKVRVHIILDACFSAGAVAAFSQPVGSVGVTILTSASSGDKSLAPLSNSATIFTRAMLDVLTRGDPEKGVQIGLRDLRELIEDEILAYCADTPIRPEIHSPKQRKGNVDEVGLFPNPAHGYTRSVAAIGEPRRWCGVVSESDSRTIGSGTFADALAGFIDRYQGRIRRETGWLFSDSPDVVNAGKVFESPRVFQEAVAKVCVADLAFFDLTSLEPGVLVLLGIRAVIRRGVTICSTSDDHDSATALPPFLLRDINMVSHGKGVAVPEQIFGARALSGIRQLGRFPYSYSDLPGFDAIRHASPASSDRTNVPYHKSVLALCPFSSAYTKDNWPSVLRFLAGAIEKQRDKDGYPDDPEGVRIERTLDMTSSQVVSLNLFTAIRVIDFCLCDLTDWNANVLFELGMRLAARPLHPVCILESNQGGSLERDAGEPGAENARLASIASQTRGLGMILNVLEYDPRRREDYRTMVQCHLAMLHELDDVPDRTWSGERLRVGGVYRVAWQYAAEPHEPSAVGVLDLLRTSALELETDRSRGSVPFIFPVAHLLTGAARQNSIERLIAAWLYLKHRKGPQRSNPDVREALAQIGYKLVELLEDSRLSEDQELLEDVFAEIELIESVLEAK